MKKYLDEVKCRFNEACDDEMGHAETEELIKMLCVHVFWENHRFENFECAKEIWEEFAKDETHN